MLRMFCGVGWRVSFRSRAFISESEGVLVGSDGSAGMRVVRWVLGRDMVGYTERLGGERWCEMVGKGKSFYFDGETTDEI